MQHCHYCCHPLGGAQIDTKEMMFGTRREFSYGLCDVCQSCSLCTPLASFDLAEFYPSDYYSFVSGAKPKGSLKASLLRCRGRYELGDIDVAGALMHFLKPGDPTFIKQFGVSTRSRVLDVGCGDGKWLFRLAEYGLTDLRGCDPFVDREVRARHVVVEKCRIEEIAGTFDYVFFHHSFEHLTDPRSSLLAARRLQEVSGRCVIRIPTTTSDAFEFYGSNWVQLDPPRHISIPSRAGMQRLASACGYELDDMIDDSSGFQFWGSEQYKSDIPLLSETSWWKNPARSAFTSADIDEFNERAKTLNARHRGDQTAFVLRAV